ncbi:MAG TPA: glycosyltransferase [Thermodesulfovibrionales bacterium]|jgi:glycosyltransferase involved in cell wall biosynthesis|nr:glycosyltransferase [Thermodesulfovibrionales bacterium]
MTHKPSVSIVSSVFNNRPYIGQTIQSVLNQTYEDWEWVIVDDGSTDGTGDIIRGVNDKRIRYIFQEHAASRHLAKNFNRALMMCNGDLIALIDGDDYWPHDKLQIQVESFDDPSVILSYGESYLVDHGGKKIGFVGIPEDLSSANNNPKGSALKILLVEKSCFIVNPTVMMRKNALLRIGGFLEVKGMGQDFPTWVRLALEGTFSAVPRCLGYYRKHASSTSFVQNREVAFSDEIRFLEHFLLEFRVKMAGLSLSHDRGELREHWEDMRRHIPYSSALYLLMFRCFEDARSEFRKFLTKAPSAKNNLIYSLVVLSSWLRTDLVNPVAFFKEKVKSLKKRRPYHANRLHEAQFRGDRKNHRENMDASGHSWLKR